MRLNRPIRRSILIGYGHHGQREPIPDDAPDAAALGITFSMVAVGITDHR